jgi:hypothetical protein
MKITVILKTILRITCPLVLSHRANIIILNQIKTKEHENSLGIIETSYETRSKLTIGNIEQYELYLKKSLIRKNIIEDKLKTIASSVAISISLILGLTGLFPEISKNTTNPLMRYVFSILAIISIIYMVAAGVLVLKTLVEDNKEYNVSLENGFYPEYGRIAEYRNCIDLNDMYNILRNNNLYTAQKFIRNALILMTILYISIFSIYIYRDKIKHIAEIYTIAYIKDLTPKILSEISNYEIYEIIHKKETKDGPLIDGENSFIDGEKCIYINLYKMGKDITITNVQKLK